MGRIIGENQRIKIELLGCLHFVQPAGAAIMLLQEVPYSRCDWHTIRFLITHRSKEPLALSHLYCHCPSLRGRSGGTVSGHRIALLEDTLILNTI